MSLVSRVKKAKCGVRITLGIRNSTAMFSSVIQLVEKFLEQLSGFKARLVYLGRRIINLMEIWTSMVSALSYTVSI